MTRRTETIPPSYFDALYAETPDPWRFRTSDYERDKYGATLAALTRDRYGGALEIGCSIGVFTAQLATRCDKVLAIDAAEIALSTARQNCADLANVQFQIGMVPNDFPAGQFDLIVLSEVLYYLHPSDLRRVAAQSLEALRPGGEIVLCHWLGETNYPLTGEEATAAFVEALRGSSVHHTILHDAVYRLDRLVKG